MNLQIIDPTSTLTDGIDLFVNMAHHFPDNTRVRDEFDLLECIDVAKDTIRNSAKYDKFKFRQDESRYCYIQDAKEQIEEWLLNGNNMKHLAANRRQNVIMYHMVIEPMMAALTQFDKQWMLENIDEVMNVIVAEVVREREMKDRDDIIKRCNIVVHTDV